MIYSYEMANLLRSLNFSMKVDRWGSHKFIRYTSHGLIWFVLPANPNVWLPPILVLTIHDQLHDFNLLNKNFFRYTLAMVNAC